MIYSGIDGGVKVILSLDHLLARIRRTRAAEVSIAVSISVAVTVTVAVVFLVWRRKVRQGMGGRLMGVHTTS